MDIFDALKKIVSAPSVSGMEDAALPVYRALLQPYTDRVFADPFGNIKAVFGNGDIFLDAHTDKIGMIVTHVYADGFLRVAPVGGVDARVLPAGAFTVLTADGAYPAFGASVPPHLASEEDRKTARKTEDTLLDTGGVAGRIQVGDRVMYADAPVRLAGDRVCAPYLDNSLGAAALLLAVEFLAERDALTDVTLCFSAQEEAGLRGAAASVFGGAHSRAIVVDTSFGDAPGVRPEHSGKLGGGAMIGFSPVLDAGMSRAFRALAQELELPYSCEIMGGGTGTNADVISRAGCGYRTALLSVPIRNMHTPAELCALSDVETVARLIAEYIIRERRGNGVA